MNYHVTAAVLGVSLAATIVWLVRRDHLHPRKAASWIALSAAIATLGVFPELADRVAAALGIAYSPTLVYAFGFVVVLIKLLRLDIARTREHTIVTTLSQKLSVLEQRVRELESGHSPDTWTTTHPDER